MYFFSQISQIVGEDGLPEIVKPKVPVKASDEEKKEFAALFDTDSEEDMDMTERWGCFTVNSQYLNTFISKHHLI